MRKVHEIVRALVRRLQKFARRIWYPPLLGLLAAADNFIVVVPTDGILISSCMLTPKRWVALALCVAVGSSAGALLLAALVELHGLPWILNLYPGLAETTAWSWTNRFFDQYGLIVVFVVAASPLLQQPSVILAGLAGTPLVEIVSVVFAGRVLKFLIMAYAGAKAPRLLNRMWGVRGELEDAGVKVPVSRKSGAS